MTEIVELKEGDVGELDSETGARLLYAAGTPEAEAWHVANAEPHDLTPTNPDADDGTDIHTEEP